ncbi:MAG: hypothetical protein NZ879_03805 [Archaeoglobaceae archaeon]|nr:hypothetical protein [Archaeoglobaceae archaeon]MDW8118090.1 hypothetical protein [Archaeoglobaceae archaeon]
MLFHYCHEHTVVELSFTHFENCSPAVYVHLKKLGVENVISSCLVQTDPFFAKCNAEKLKSDVKLDPVCIDDFKGNFSWILSLYGKHTFFSYPKIELINKSLSDHSRELPQQEVKEFS